MEKANLSEPMKQIISEKSAIDCGSKVKQPHELVAISSHSGSARLSNSLTYADNEGLLDGISIQAVLSDDKNTLNKLMRIPNFGIKTLSELKSLMLRDDYTMKLYDQRVLQSVFEENSKRLSQFINTNSAPNIPISLSNIQINIGLLSTEEQKLLKKIESLFGRMDLRSFLNINQTTLTEVGGFGKKYLSNFSSICTAISDEFFSIVDGFKKFDLTSKSLFVTSNDVAFDLQDIDQILLDDIEDYLFSINSQDRELAMARWGFHCRAQTLEELGIKYGLTRERIRQKIQIITSNLLLSTRISSEVLRENLVRQGCFDLQTTLKNLASCFEDEKSFISFLEILSQSKKGAIFDMVHPSVPRSVIDAYFIENISPIDFDALAGYLESNYGYEKTKSANALKDWSRNSIIKVVDGAVSPKSLGKVEAAAHILLYHPAGLPWKDIARLINKSGYCDTPVNEIRQIQNYLSDSDYIYLCGRGVYRHLKYLDVSKINVNSIMDDLLEYFVSNNVDSINLHDFYHEAKPYIKEIDYFDLRQIVRSSCDVFGFFFNGKSGADGLGITPNFSKVTQQKLILEVMNKAKSAMTKVEIAERLRSKSIGHASFYLEKMMDQGQVVRIDNMMYTTPDRAFKNIDTEKILQLIQNILIETDKIVEADVFRLIINSELNLSYPKYFYAALASINIQKYGWKKNYNLFSCKEISYTGMTEACSILCDPELPNSKNLERIREKFLLTDQAAGVILNNWRASIDI